MSTKSNSTIVKTASWLAGTAFIGNALFGRAKDTMSWSIIAVYMLFGGLLGTFRYVGNVLRWLSYEGVETRSRVLHIVLPPATLVVGPLAWFIMATLNATNGLVVLTVAIAYQAICSYWAFNILRRVNLVEDKPDQVTFATASYMYIGFVVLLMTVWGFSQM